MQRICAGSVSTHALREEGDHSCGSESGISWYFNPRPPWGERPLAAAAAEQHTQFQSTPSARRATVVVQIAIVHDRISIHALREEGDLAGQVDAVGLLISIHALREEGDAAGCLCFSVSHNFNPRPPRGGRLQTMHRAAPAHRFQSTPSARRATGSPFRRAERGAISIHALREEGDERQRTHNEGQKNFNPRPPRGGRQQKQRKNPPLLFHYTRLCTI